MPLDLNGMILLPMTAEMESKSPPPTPVASLTKSMTEFECTRPHIALPMTKNKQQKSRPARQVRGMLTSTNCICKPSFSLQAGSKVSTEAAIQYSRSLSVD